MNSPTNGESAYALVAPKTFFPMVRHLSYRLTPVLARTPLSANHITFISLLFGLGCAWAVAQGERAWDVAAGGFLIIAYVLDNCDGEIARMKGQCSTFGMHFDTFVDWLVNSAFFAALGYGTAKATGEDWWWWLGLAAAAGATVNYLLSIYLGRRDQKNMNGAETDRGQNDHAQPEGEMPETASEWVIFAFRELSRADFCFIVLGLGLFGLAWVLVPFGAIGAQVYWMTQFARSARKYRV